MTLSRKRFHSVLEIQRFSQVSGTVDEDELFELYLQLDAIGAGLIRTMDGIIDLIFLFEDIDLDNVEYFSNLKNKYSSDIFTTQLLRRYRIETVTWLLFIGMSDTLNRAYIFFESKDPVRWGKKLDFYKSKLKAFCDKDAYVPMIEIIDGLYRVLVKLHFDKNCRKADEIYFSQLIFTDTQLVRKVFGDKDGNFDDSMKLSEFYFDFDQTNEVISKYESSHIKNSKHSC